MPGCRASGEHYVWDLWRSGTPDRPPSSTVASPSPVVIEKSAFEVKRRRIVRHLEADLAIVRAHLDT